MDEDYFKRLFSLVILITLLVLCFFIVKPILIALITGFILAFIFMPVYKKLLKWTKHQNLSSLIICVGLLFLLVLPLWFLLPIGVDQAVKVYFAARNFDFVTPLKAIFPSTFASDTFAIDAGGIIGNFIIDLTDKLVRSFSNLILEIPFFTLQLLVTFFTLFFTLRDKDKLFEFIGNLSPFSRDVEKRLKESSSTITAAILYGQVVIGAMQGVILGIGFFIFGVPNALIFTLLAIFAGILPIIGTSLIWVPILIYALVNFSFINTMGILLFGILSSNLENFLRPLIISKKVKVPTSIIMIGMIGGVFYLGVLGFILGPLIIAYLLIVLEEYQFKKNKSQFFVEEQGDDFSLMNLIR